VLPKNKTSEKIMSLFSKKAPKVEVDDDHEIVPRDEMSEFDGFYFVPDDDDYEENCKIAFFKIKDGEGNSEPIESSEMGLKYHLCLFTHDENSLPVFDDAFEAILVDPLVYVKGLVGTGISGCIVKKSEKSEKWWIDYLDYIMNGEFKQKAREALESVAQN
jgi:hypothetical protein